MRGSLFKYIDQRQDDQGRSLFWPGSQEGFPFRGEKPPNLTDNEYENLRLFCDAFVDTFYMNDPEHKKRYQEILDRVANGWYFIRDRDRRWDDDKKCYVIFLEWIQVYAETPRGIKPFSLMGTFDESPIPERSVLDEIYGPVNKRKNGER